MTTFPSLPLLETDRLDLRELEPADLQDVYEYASDPQVAATSLWKTHRSLDDSLDYITGAIDQYRRHDLGPWGVILRAENKLIGTIAFASWNANHARIEIGYALSRRYWNRGFATEAARRVIEYGFDALRLNRISAYCGVDNIASARVLEKAGMRFEGVLRGYALNDDAHHDVKLYAIVRDDISHGGKEGPGEAPATARHPTRKKSAMQG